jgi:hypothetical protein
VPNCTHSQYVYSFKGKTRNKKANMYAVALPFCGVMTLLVTPSCAEMERCNWCTAAGHVASHCSKERKRYTCWNQWLGVDRRHIPFGLPTQVASCGVLCDGHMAARALKWRDCRYPLAGTYTGGVQEYGVEEGVGPMRAKAPGDWRGVHDGAVPGL